MPGRGCEGAWRKGPLLSCLPRRLRLDAGGNSRVARLRRGKNERGHGYAVCVYARGRRSHVQELRRRAESRQRTWKQKGVRSTLLSGARGDGDGRAREAGRGQLARNRENDVRVMTSAFPAHKTKIVATIGPASESPEMLVRLIRAGVNVARLNFSHGDFSRHAEVTRRIRDAARETGRRVAIMADLPGPKMRLGKIDPEPIQLLPGARFTLTNEDIVGNSHRVSVSFEPLPRGVKPGNRIFLNDGLVQLVVERVVGNDVECTVAVGGELRSRKGLNLPGIELGISAFTEKDRVALEFALGIGADAVSQSFVHRAADIEAVREAAAKL